MRRQAASDVVALALLDLFLLHDTERQAALFRDVIEPRAESLVDTTKAAFLSGRVPLLELLESQRALLDIRLALAQLSAEHEKTLVRLESLAAVDVSGGEAP